MKNPIKRYQFWFKVLAAAILLTLGIVIIFNEEVGTMLVLGASGAAVLIMGVIRFVPLMKTLQSGKSKIASAIEMAIDIIIGIILFYGAVTITKEGGSKAADFINKNYKYFMGFVLYLRGVIYFMISVLFSEPSDKVQFWVHLGFLTVGVLFVSLSDEVTSRFLATIIAVISLLCSAALIVDGGVSFGRYRKYVKENVEKSKVKEIVDEASIEVPARDGENKEIDETDEKEIIDPKEDSERPYIN